MTPTLEHRIYIGIHSTKTGNIYNQATVEAVVDRHIGTYTLIKTESFWQGKASPTIILIFINCQHPMILEIAEDLKKTLKQSSVLLTASKITGEYI